MSLRPEDAQNRGRSRSPGRRDRSCSRADDDRPRERSRSRQAYDRDPEEEREMHRKYEATIRGRGEPVYVVESEYSTRRDDESAGRGYMMSGGRHDDDLAYGKLDGRDYAKEEKYRTYDPKSTGTFTYGYGDTPRSSTSFIKQPRSDYCQVNKSYNTRSATQHTQSYESETKFHSRTPSPFLTVESDDRAPSPGLAPRIPTLSVYGPHHSLSSAPASPLLEAYRGTYQSVSPMPSPMLLPTHFNSSLDMLEPLSPRSSASRHARFHDPSDDARILATALSPSKKYPDLGPLIQILPSLTHAQMLDMRTEYKNLVKTGSGHDVKGVNVAKHIKLRLKEEDSNFLKVCYVCALGQWESEAYWANFWYHGSKSNRELLIESLMGRTNDEIVQIKAGFKDKKYGDSLIRCMRTELKEDKFKKAVLLVLDEKRMEESRSGRIDRELVDDDVHALHRALKSEKGGESAMISIIIARSDTHLRECLRVYETTYRSNFARDMLKKSGNLVGELLAHILNGVINPPVRDVLLLNQAVKIVSQYTSTSSSSNHHHKHDKHDKSRPELLISRLVRCHWDRPHFEKVKREYRGRYGIELVDAVREATTGDFGEFMQGLCVRR